MQCLDILEEAVSSFFLPLEGKSTLKLKHCISLLWTENPFRPLRFFSILSVDKSLLNLPVHIKYTV